MTVARCFMVCVVINQIVGFAPIPGRTRQLGWSITAAHQRHRHDQGIETRTSQHDRRLVSASRRQTINTFLSLSGSLLWKASNAWGKAPLDSLSDEAIMENLRSPTDEKPRIPLPTQGTKVNTLEGLISLSDPTLERRPSASDVIVLTVRPISDPEKVLAGAQLPVSRIRSFPVRFVLNEKNAISADNNLSKDVSRRTWKNALETTDMVVEAVVCRRDFVEEQKSAGQSLLNTKGVCNSTTGLKLGGEGFAKLLRFNTGPTGSDPIIIRAPVSVVLN